jgi:cell division protein FtsI (penicillin-binding protein 3)
MKGVDRKTNGQQRAPAGAPSTGRRIPLLVLKVALALCFFVIVLRLVQIQVIDAPRYQEIARRQYEARVVLPAVRGTIFDRHGSVLVSNSMRVSFGADPKLVKPHAFAVAATFAAAFGKGRSGYLEKLLTPNKRFVWLERQVKPDYVKRVAPGEYEGLVVMNEPQRIYYYDQLAAQCIGFTDLDTKGLGGVELACDRDLQGVDGYVIMQRDGLGRKHPSVDYPRVEPVNGHHIVLTIDLEYQAVAEEELHKGITRSRAESGLVVMLDPRTGEVLAMANAPGINPNMIAKADKTWLRNRAITDMFEPGSVFKIVVASAALENRVVKPTQKFSAEHGTYVVRLPGGQSRTITDAHPFDVLTFQEGVEKSSNIVMAKISNLVGAESFYVMARNFGFGTTTGLGLPGEVSGELKKPSAWSGLTLNTMAYGYEVAVTPMQIAAAYAAVANGGLLMKPFIVQQVLNENNEVLSAVSPQTIRRVMSKETAETLTRMLVGVVERGTGSAARLASIEVAGKTGTSRKFVEGKYASGSYTASFVGFFPANDPKVVCLVMLDNPRAGGYTGGYASAPIFRNIAEKICAMSEQFSTRPASAPGPPARCVVPDVVTLSPQDATSVLAARRLRTEMRGMGAAVLRQSPSPGTEVAPGSVVTLFAQQDSGPIPDGYRVVPDLRNLTIRRAVTLLTVRQLDAAIEGSGVVVSHIPPAGRQVRTGTRITLRCEPRSQAATSLLQVGLTE